MERKHPFFFFFFAIQKPMNHCSHLTLQPLVQFLLLLSYLFNLSLLFAPVCILLHLFPLSNTIQVISIHFNPFNSFLLLLRKRTEFENIQTIVWSNFNLASFLYILSCCPCCSQTTLLLDQPCFLSSPGFSTCCFLYHSVFHLCLYSHL